jgi:predicted nucleic acid-binding protein
MTTAAVVSNASPLIALEQMGCLHLLEQLFGKILVPPAVAREVAPTVTLPAWVEQHGLTQLVGQVTVKILVGRVRRACYRALGYSLNLVGAP